MKDGSTASVTVLYCSLFLVSVLVTRFALNKESLNLLQAHLLAEQLAQQNWLHVNFIPTCEHIQMPLHEYL